MKYNLLGITDMEISHISLSGASFGMHYGSYTEAQNIGFIKDCIFRGVNFIDTCPWFGQGHSESLIGKAVSGVLRDIYYISTRVGRYDTEDQMFNHSAERTFRSVEESLARLGLSYVDIVQIDYVSYSNIETILNETLPALRIKVLEGKVRHITIGDYNLPLLKRIVDESNIHISAIVSHARSTLLDNTLQNYAQYFKNHGVGVINSAPTAIGLLTNEGPLIGHPAGVEIKAICAMASQLCKNRNVDMTNLAQYFSLLQPNVDTTICGFRNIPQLIDTIRVMKYGLTSDEEAVLKELLTNYFNRPAMNWDSESV